MTDVEILQAMERIIKPVLTKIEKVKTELEERMDRWLQVFKFPSAERNLRPPGMYRQAPDLSDHRQQGGGRHHLSGHQGVA